MYFSFFELALYVCERAGFLTKSLAAWVQVLFKKGMEVELLGLEQSEQDLVVGAGTLHGLPGDSCHGAKLLDGEASVCVNANYVNDYSIYEPIHQDDPPVTCMGQCKGMFIMWRMAAMKI